MSTKMLKRYCLPFILASCIFTACSTDFEINDKWKEINIIYGLLSIDDSVQYIKINKAYLNENTDAVKVARVADSIYHQDSLSVTLEEWVNSQRLSTTQLSRTYLENKDTGVFAFPGQYLYTPPTGFKLDPQATYKLLVANTVTGVTSTSSVEIVDSILPGTPIPVFGTLNFIPNSNTPIAFFAGQGAKFYEIYVYFYISEMDALTGQLESSKTLKWPLATKYIVQNTRGGYEVRLSIPGDKFFEFLQLHLNEDNSIFREVDSVKMEVLGGGEELFNYTEANTPSIGVVQKTTVYTNIDNGYGLFSSRTHDFFRVGLNNNTKELLKTDHRTQALNFR